MDSLKRRRSTQIGYTFLMCSAHLVLLNANTAGVFSENTPGHGSAPAGSSPDTMDLLALNKLSSPRFISFTVKEDTLPGTVVGKLDLPPTSPTPITFSVLEDDGQNLFLLSPLSGEFLLSRGLDFETQSLFILSVGAQMGQDVVSSVRVYFNVLDVNDNPPVFIQEAISLTLQENMWTGACFLALNVSDKDDGENGELNLKIIDGDDEEQLFFIDSPGLLCLRSQLNRERHAFHNLTITASDCARPPSPQFTTTAFVSILVEDVNDNPPSFASRSRTVFIPEDVEVNSTVMTAPALDPDEGLNGEVWYYLTNSSGGVFRIDRQSGTIYLQERLDRERVDSFSISAVAVDNGSPPLSATMDIMIIVEDSNDHSPLFTQNAFLFEISEDVLPGTSIFQVQAHDRDVGKNGQVRYTLEDASVFIVDSVTGDIAVMFRLDRENTPQYLMTLKAADQGNPPRETNVTLNVTVLDVNDFTPVFSPDTVTIHVMENGVDTTQLIYEVTAQDEDLGLNSELSYSILTGNKDFFSVSPKGMLLIADTLDREEESLYSLVIVAVDLGVPPCTGTMTLHVAVEDINDNPPEFSEEAYHTIVSEDSQTGTVFAMITASDRDYGQNGKIRYSFERVDVPFSVEEESGELFTTDALDREATAEYRLTVIATDGHPTHPLSSSVLVTVLIGDVNDNAPRFGNSPFVAYMPSEVEQGMVVCVASATDEDTDMNAKLRYSLYQQASDGFSIDAHSGTVFSSIPLMASEDKILHIHVEDSGENPKFDSSTITIRFQKASEFPQMIVDVMYSYLAEDEPVGTVVAMVTGLSSREEHVLFYLASGNSEDFFQMDEKSGILTVQKSLDYELKKDFTLLIEARVSGSPPFSSYQEIYINVTDVNDNAPLFSQMVYRCTVFENMPPTLVCDVLAIDADSGVFGAVQYNITDGNSGYVFMIDAESGLLSTTVSLDREYNPMFNLTIEAVEWYNPDHTDQATVIVSVLDRNDNAPQFSQFFIAEVPEDSPIGHTILHITATDDDSEANLQTTYSITDESNHLPFSIDGLTGYITVSDHLDREVSDSYHIKVSVNDSVWGTSTDITINITDVNDNRPIFFDRLYSVTLTENVGKDVFVAQVHATDADVGLNGKILYVIEPPSDHFSVNLTNGAVYTKQPLSQEYADYHFKVVAYDCGTTSMSSKVSVVVKLEKLNHYSPVFLPFPSLMAIPYNLSEGGDVAQFTAVDPDENNSSANIQYALSEGNGTDFFDIDPNNGKVKLFQSLPDKVNLFLVLSVVATDAGHPQLRSEISVTFETTGQNVHSPSFRETHVSFSVPEDLPEGSVIGRCQADDEDVGYNGVVMYYLEGHRAPFIIGEISGLITLIGKLDFEKEEVYDLQVVAKDGGWASRTGLLNVTVVIVDVNDNPPIFTISQFVASVSENAEIGTFILSVTATDADSSSFGQIVYTVAAGQVNKFAIDSRNGTITTLDTFDYEQHPTSFDLTLKAANLGGQPLFSLAHVIIKIIDVNEYIPRFKEKEFYFSISKSVPTGTRIGKVEATDHDLGPEGKVSYLMFGRNKYLGFDIHQTSGEIYTTGSLRKKGNTNIVLKVMAKNSGVITGEEVEEALVIVSVINTNDAPRFDYLEYFVNVTEDSPVGSYVTAVTAVDLDSLQNDLFYAIQDGNTDFSFAVNPSNGIILVNSPLDREQWPLYNLTITAADFGFPPATGTTSVIVIIGDVNDNAPLLTVTEAQIKENLPQGSLVEKLNAIDSDLPPNQGPFTYWLVNPLRDSDVSLTPDGVLFTTRPLDREKFSIYQVLVASKDAGTPPMTSTTIFHIHILDENDNPPSSRNIFIEVKYFGSSFQGGAIGNVKPDDPDQSDTFTCTVKTAPLNMFSIANGSCELWSSPFQGEATYNITIEATDQLHYPVNNSVYVNYKGFMNASVDNSILFYVPSTSMEEFLANKYLRFVKALDSLFNLQASKTHVFGIKQVASEVLLLAAVKNYNGQYLSREVARSLSSDHKRVLESQSNITFSHIASDPCLTIPCRNGATCNKNLFISQDVAVLQSPTVIFVSPQKEIFNCTCPVGFIGEVCEVDVDECEESPCENGGTCKNSPGGFRCECKIGFSGTVCSLDIERCMKMNCQNNGTCVHTDDVYYCHCIPGFEGLSCEHAVDYCRSSPCVMGTCINLKTEFSCLCPAGVSGVFCEEQSYGFGELSYLEFPPLDRSTNLISLEFATVLRNALLVYCPGEDDSADFLAIEIVDGSVRLTYDLGSGAVRLQTLKQVADGEFHLLSVRRIGSMASLNVDNCTDVEREGFCFSQTFGILERTLDVGNANMTFGGMRSIEHILLHPGQTQTHAFVGCLRQIFVNGIQLRPSMSLSMNNIRERSKTPPCHSNPCQNDGVCFDNWYGFICECSYRFTGQNCNQEVPPELAVPFGGSDSVEFVVKEHFRRDYMLKAKVPRNEEPADDFSSVNIRFKTKENGLLMTIWGQKRFNILQIKEGKLSYLTWSRISGHQSDRTVDALVADGLWHVMTVSTDSRTTTIMIDSDAMFNTTDRLDLSPQNVEKIVLGGAHPGYQQTGFRGCVQYVTIGGYTLPLSGPSRSVEAHPSPSLLHGDCGSSEACLPAPCPEAECERRCLCLHNASDASCDVCGSPDEKQCSDSEARADQQPTVLIALLLSVFAFMTLVCVALSRKRKMDIQKRKVGSDMSKALGIQFAKPRQLSKILKLSFPKYTVKQKEAKTRGADTNSKENSDCLSRGQVLSPEKSPVFTVGRDAPMPYPSRLNTDVTRPPQCLTFEEIDKLFASFNQSNASGGASKRATDSSESETDTTCTCSDCGHCLNDSASLKRGWPFEGQWTHKKAHSAGPGRPEPKGEQPCSLCAFVPESVTQLPLEIRAHDCEMQSDFEETI